MSASIPISAGRSAFGHDPAAYAAARPDYPDAFYAVLVERCGLGPGRRVFEIGAGTGLATKRLLALGAAPLLAVEPDPRLAAYLLETVDAQALEIAEETFEAVALPQGVFDLGVSATAFHWLEQAPALAKVKAALRPGGWWAMGWNNFGDDGKLDPFQAATDHLFVGTPAAPSHGKDGRPPFALDRDARMADLAATGLVDAEAHVWRWSTPLDTACVVALYRTFSPIQALPADSRERFLEALARIADDEFGGRVERPFSTSLYTARKP
jgi:SAM-dependent methyltransferase